MPEQSDLFADDLDLVAIQRRAQAEALRIRGAARRRGRAGAFAGRCPERVARAHLEALKELLGEPRRT